MSVQIECTTCIFEVDRCLGLFVYAHPLLAGFCRYTQVCYTNDFIGSRLSRAKIPGIRRCVRAGLQPYNETTNKLHGKLFYYLDMSIFCYAFGPTCKSSARYITKWCGVSRGLGARAAFISHQGTHLKVRERVLMLCAPSFSTLRLGFERRWSVEVAWRVKRRKAGKRVVALEERPSDGRKRAVHTRSAWVDGYHRLPGLLQRRAVHAHQLWLR